LSAAARALVREARVFLHGFEGAPGGWPGLTTTIYVKTGHPLRPAPEGVAKHA
jgi:hypothetical protein